MSCTKEKLTDKTSINVRTGCKLPTVACAHRTTIQDPTERDCFRDFLEECNRFMPLFSVSDLVDSATAGDTLEDNQPLSARCTS